MTETCSNCRFGHEIAHEAGKDTFCRERPPEFVPPNSSALKPVRPEGWCGKWVSAKPVKRAVR